MLVNKENLFDHFIPTKIISLQIPDCIDFGYCCVNKKYVKIYKLFNYSKTPIEFNFTDCYFSISPQRGIINPNSNQSIEISCVFSNAKVIVAKTTLMIRNEEPKVLKVSAIGKYPFFKLSKNSISFSNILVNNPQTDHININNVSEVGTEFYIEQIKDDEFDDGSIHISPNHGYLPSKEVFQLNIKYKPSIPDFLSYRRFRVRFYGGNEETFEVFGQSQKMHGKFDRYKLNFGNVKLGKSITKTLTLFNEVNQKLNFEIINVCGVFSINKKKHNVNPNSYTTLKIKFEPTKPLNYFLRIYCFVRNQDILYIDLYGSCNELLVKPLPLNMYTGEEMDSATREIKSMTLNQSKNDTKLPFMFTKYEKENQNKINTQEKPMPKLDLQNTLTEPIVYRNESISEKDNNNIFKYLINEEAKKNKVFSITTRYLDFGTTGVDNFGSARYFEITNNKNIDLYFHFFNKDTNFSLDKTTVKLLPMSTVSVKVLFKPRMEGRFYFTKVQTVITTEDPKEMQANNARNDKFLVLTDYIMYFIGNTFIGKAQPFIPMVNLDPDKELLFPPCKIEQTVYQTFRISNLTDTSCLFKIEKPKGPFKLYPQYGHISKNSYSNIIVEFSPKKTDFYKESLVIVLNTINKKKILLKGYCLKSNIELFNEGRIFFTPSYLGVKTMIDYPIRNKGRMTTELEIKVPSNYVKELDFVPKKLVLQANETKKIQCYFMPLKKMNYKIKCPVIADNEESNEFKINVFGEGSDGEVTIEPEKLDIGIVMVNFVKTTQLTLHNKSESTFNIKINKKVELCNSIEDTSSGEGIKSDFLIDFNYGIIPAKSKKTINLTFNPKNICDAKLFLEVICCSNSDFDKNKEEFDKYETVKAVCEIKVKANYPLLKIIDIRNNELSLSSLWEKFDISAINKELSKSLSCFEKKYALNTKKLFDTAKDPDAINREFLWDFGYLHSNNKSKLKRVITMVIQNIGGTDLEWYYRLDDKLKYEYKNNNKNSALVDFDRDFSRIQHFTFKPKSGKLKPKEKQKIYISYSPTIFKDSLEKMEDGDGEVI